MVGWAVASGEEGDADDANEDPEEAEAMDVNLQLAGACQSNCVRA